MVDKDIYTKNGEVCISRISDCNCYTIDKCKKECNKYNSCRTIALANDLQKEYEQDQEYIIKIKNIILNTQKEIKIYSSLRYVITLRKALIQDIVDELYTNDIIDKYGAEDISWASKESLKYYEIEEAGVIFEVNEGWEN